MASKSESPPPRVTFEQSQLNTFENTHQDDPRSMRERERGSFSVIVPTAGVGEKRDWAIGTMKPDEICALAEGHHVWFTARYPFTRDFRHQDRIPLGVLRAFSPSVDEAVRVCGCRPEEVTEVVVFADSRDAFHTLTAFILNTFLHHNGVLKDIPYQRQLPIYKSYMISRLAWTLKMKPIRDQMHERIRQFMYGSERRNYTCSLRDVQLVFCCTPRDHWLRKWLVTSMLHAARDGNLTNKEQVNRYIASNVELQREVALEQRQHKTRQEDNVSLRQLVNGQPIAPTNKDPDGRSSPLPYGISKPEHQATAIESYTSNTTLARKSGGTDLRRA